MNAPSHVEVASKLLKNGENVKVLDPVLECQKLKEQETVTCKAVKVCAFFLKMIF